MDVYLRAAFITAIIKYTAATNQGQLLYIEGSEFNQVNTLLYIICYTDAHWSLVSTKTL